jgi:hypothetical protein
MRRDAQRMAVRVSKSDSEVFSSAVLESLSSESTDADVYASNGNLNAAGARVGTVEGLHTRCKCSRG